MRTALQPGHWGSEWGGQGQHPACDPALGDHGKEGHHSDHPVEERSIREYRTVKQGNCWWVWPGNETMAPHLWWSRRRWSLIGRGINITSSLHHTKYRMEVAAATYPPHPSRSIVLRGRWSTVSLTLTSWKTVLFPGAIGRLPPPRWVWGV